MESDDPAAGRQTLAGLIETLRLSGLSEETAADLARQAAERGEVDDGGGAGRRRSPTRRARRRTRRR